MNCKDNIINKAFTNFLVAKDYNWWTRMAWKRMNKNSFHLKTEWKKTHNKTVLNVVKLDE